MIPRDPEAPERAHRLEVLERVRDGKLYDGLTYAFIDELDGTGEYVEISKRRPSILTNLAGLVVEDSVALLFSESHFPSLDTADEVIRAKLEMIAKRCRLNELMADAAYKGSVGSVAIWMRIIKGNFAFQAMPTKNLTPYFDPDNPHELLRVEEKFKVEGSELKASGYTPANGYPKYEEKKSYWFQRDFTDSEEIWYIPWESRLPIAVTSGSSLVRSLMGSLPLDPDTRDAEPKRDERKTTKHKLKRVPMVWIKNLGSLNEADGYCTFERGIPTVIELDYLLSQGSRGVKYNADPVMLIKDKNTDVTSLRKDGNVLQTDTEGDAKLLELNGGAAKSVIEFAMKLRETALEAMHGNRANADRISAAQSGVATELLYQPLIMVADRLRSSYGEFGLLALLRMIIAATNAYPELEVHGQKIGRLKEPDDLALRWNKWFPLTGQDHLNNAQALVALTSGGIMSQKTATKTIADDYDLEGIDAEVKEIAQNMADNDAREIALAKATKPTTTPSTASKGTNVRSK
jgi:hypothetical protein